MGILLIKIMVLNSGNNHLQQRAIKCCNFCKQAAIGQRGDKGAAAGPATPPAPGEGAKGSGGLQGASHGGVTPREGAQGGAGDSEGIWCKEAQPGLAARNRSWLRARGRSRAGAGHPGGLCLYPSSPQLLHSSGILGFLLFVLFFHFFEP